MDEPRVTEPAQPTTVAAQNRIIVRGAFDAWRAGRAPITDLFAPQMTWRIEGRSIASGDYADRQAFIDEVLAPFGARFAEGEPFRPQEIHGVHADGDAVIVHWQGHGVANDGEPYDNAYVWLMRLSHGLVVDGVAFFDSIAFDELWRRVQPGH
jgi:ketosteroid isomerase-like protein